MEFFLRIGSSASLTAHRKLSDNFDLPMRRFLAFLLSLLISNAMSIAANPGGRKAFEESRPEITSIHWQNVHVSVPEGYEKVWIEVLTRATTGKRKKALAPTWKVQEERFMRGAAGSLIFKLKTLTPRRNMRVFGSRVESMPPAWAGGISDFPPVFVESPQVELGQVMSIAIGGGRLPVMLTNGGVVGTTSFSGAALSISGNTTVDSDFLSAGDLLTKSREVSEADIWRLNGDRLYYYNQYRGLQVFDLSDDSNPAMMGTLRMPGSGDDMYLLDQAHVVLLKRKIVWNWWFNEPIHIMQPGLGVSPSPLMTLDTVSSMRYYTSQADAYEVVVANVADGVPSLAGKVEFQGNVRESRLVGRVLYIAVDFSGYRDQKWKYGTLVISFDLHDPAHPIKKDEVFVEGVAASVNATSRFLFLAAQTHFGNSKVTAVDISSPNGLMKRMGSVEVSGNVPDKFKMNLDGDVFTVVSTFSKELTAPPAEAQKAERNGERIWWNRWVPVSRVSTFSLTNPAAPVALGTLDLAEGEQLHATRFDEKRLYVVTALHGPSWGIIETPPPGTIIDPLWVVDLSNPSEPKAVGELIIPGFSTYIHPLGDRLVTIGLVDDRPTVSLFDVADPASPTQLSRLQLGTESGWTSSEAVWNEKAFSVLSEQGLILLPLSSDNNEIGKVQLIDLKRNSLTKRGVITGAFAPQRATAHVQSLVAISPTRLVTVDASNRSLPVIKADLEIAWPADHVFHVGEYLIQISGNVWSQQASVTVTPADKPDETLNVTELPSFGVAGATVRDGVLHILQSHTTFNREDGSFAPASPRQIFSAYDLTQLPAIKKLGQTSVSDAKSWMVEATAHWPSATTLVWARESEQLAWYRSVSSSFAPPEGLIDLCAVDVNKPSQLRFLSRMSFVESLSGLIAADGKMLASYLYHGDSRGAVHWLNNELGEVRTDASMRGRYYLMDVDYSNPAQPVRNPANHVNIPGELIGHSKNGRVIYTSGARYGDDGKAVADQYAIHATGYDGTKAQLIDQITFAHNKPPVAYNGETLFLMGRNSRIIEVPNSVSPVIEPLVESEAVKTEVPEVETPPLSDFSIRMMSVYLDSLIFMGPIHIPDWILISEQWELQSWKLTDSGKFNRLGELPCEAQSLFRVNDLVLASEGGAVSVVNVKDPSAMKIAGSLEITGYGSARFEDADGDSESGVWIPRGVYGVDFTPLKNE